MFDTSSKERQAHHQFLMMSPEQQKQVDNHELLGSAAAYHAASAFTDHCEKGGLPEDKSEATKILHGFANSFIAKEKSSKEMSVDSQQALHYATQALSAQMEDKPTSDWLMDTTPTKVFDAWTQDVKMNGNSDYYYDTYNITVNNPYGKNGSGRNDTYNITVNNGGQEPRYERLPPPEPCW